MAQEGIEIFGVNYKDDPAKAMKFLDDLGVNLKPARAMGMYTIKVEDSRVALRELEAVIYGLRFPETATP